MKINPAILMGGVAGARSHSGPAREAAKEIGSSVPWIGFPVGYAISGVYDSIRLPGHGDVPIRKRRVAWIGVFGKYPNWRYFSS
jgi:hypothetical protein